MNRPIKICIISTQILSKQKLGGFGSMTKNLARSLANKGYEVIVVTPREKGAESQNFEEFRVIGLSLRQMMNPKIFKRINADVYHSQSPSLPSVTALLVESRKKHVFTCRDPRDLKDWLIEIRDATWKRKFRNIPLSLIYEGGPLVDWAVSRADAVAYATYWIKPKIEKMYKLKKEPVFLPNIEGVPKKVPRKADKPTVCFVGRLDGIKRPELFIELAGDFPKVNFLVVGQAEERKRQGRLEASAKKHPNIKMLGYIDKFDGQKLYEVYNKSWILVNTSSKEVLPLTFIEATGRGCAILSYVNPDNFASRFGFWAKNNNFKEGLTYLLEKNRWKEKGREAHKYVYDTYRAEKAIETHVSLYRELLINEKG